VTTAQTTSTSGKNLVLQGNGLNGSTGVLPTGITTGDLFKLVIDITNSNAAGWTNCTAANILATNMSAGAQSLTVSDGITLYASYNGSNAFTLFSTADEAFSQASQLFYGVSATVTFTLQCWISFVGSVGSLELIPNF